MPYLGNELATQFQAFVTQTITGDGSTGYTLDRAVANGKELLVYINNVKQEEGSGKSYTASGTTITFSEAVASGDSCYLVYLGSAVQTVVPPDASIVSGMFANSALTLPNTLNVDAGITVDNITIDGTEIDLSSGDLTLDSGGDIILDADGANIIFKDGGTSFGEVKTNSTPDHFIFTSLIEDKDYFFQGNDGGTIITALQLDMSDAGAATLNNGLTLTDGNLTVASGHGIDFSATGDASESGTSMTSELLDDYEEGTFTPGFSQSGATIGYSSRGGIYTKIGNMVFASGRLFTSSISGGSGNIKLGGLPFTPATAGTGGAHAAVYFNSTFGGWSSTNCPKGGFINDGDTDIDMRTTDSSDARNQVDTTITTFSDSSVGLIFTATYRAS